METLFATLESDFDFKLKKCKRSKCQGDKPVSERYDAPYAFTGDLHEVVIRVPERRSDAEKKAAAESEMSRQ